MDNQPFVIGQRVVCVRHGWANPRHTNWSGIKKGVIFKVKQLHLSPVGSWHIRLNESLIDGLWFPAIDFRPIHQMPEDISQELAEEAMNQRKVETDVVREIVNAENN